MRIRKERRFTGTTDSRITKREQSHRAVARKAAAEGIVMLENKGPLLPLKKGEKIALYGVGASKTIKGGTGSGDVNERDCVTICQGLKQAGFQITTEDWLTDYDKRYDAARTAWRDGILAKTANAKDASAFFHIYSTNPFVMPAGGPIQKTEAQIAFYILSRVAGEGADRFNAPGDYVLTPEEQQQLSDICAFYPHVVVVINTGGLVDLSFIDEFPNIEVLLYVVQPGMEGGSAFADLVLGNITPSGKLTDTWANQYRDYPNSSTFSHNNGNVEQEFYEEGIYVGYRYFDTFEIPVRYSFGYGGSYTEFQTDFCSAAWDSSKKSLTVTARVQNTGTLYSGKEVVQLYVTCPDGRLEKEFRRLAAFGKTRLLQPGESQTLTLEVSPEYLSSYCEKTPGWMLEKGTYVLWLGNSLIDSVPAAALSLEQDVLLTKTRHIAPLQEPLRELSQNTGKAQAHSEESGEDSAPSEKSGEDSAPSEESGEDFAHSCSRISEGRRTALLKQARELLPVITLPANELEGQEIRYRENEAFQSEEARAFVESLPVEKLIALASGDPGKAQGGNLGAAGISVPGSAGETSSCALEENLASIVLADGPAGLRLMKYYNVLDGKILSKPFEFSLEGGLFCPDSGNEPGERYYQYCTAIPVGTLLAQTWDCGLIQEVGRMIGAEMEEFSVTLWLAPGMNIHRNPLCGRNFEYYSEDPLLSGKMAAAMTLGVQQVPGCGTTIKHLACNGQEDNRMGSDSILSERTLREIYLKGFEITIKESQPMAVMTSYNLVNGIHMANHKEICTDVLRSEWGFAGIIMTDWTTTEQDMSCTASGCMRAGNDLVMPGACCDRENLQAELKEGTLKLSDLRACISRLVEIIWQSNQYEGAVPYQKQN